MNFVEYDGGIMAEKEELEKKKLQAEIDEIELRIESDQGKIDSERKNALKDNIRRWTALVMGFITIISGIVAIWINSSTFLAQKKKEYEFNINREMIILVQQLSSGKKYERDNAAILLSAFEKDAVPILLNNLDRRDSPEATIESLKLISEKEGVTNEVLDPLIKRAEEVFDREYRKSDVEYTSIINYVKALEKLGKEKENDVLELLNEVRKKIEKKQDITSARKTLIAEAIDLALENLKISSVTR